MKWWTRIPMTLCRREILLLLVWKLLFRFSRLVDFTAHLALGLGYLGKRLYLDTFFNLAAWVSFLLAPAAGWLADTTLGRYKMVIYSARASFTATILSGTGLLVLGVSGAVLSFIAIPFQYFGYIGFLAAMLPYITDQLEGASADEISAVVYWYYWVDRLNACLGVLILCILVPQPISFEMFSLMSATFLALLLISDCFCQQWLNKTHKVSNPIKLIFQVLNYTRKNKYPQRRSAFTYIDEEQPSRIDFGKEKFGGPFTEEEVEDVKTVLRLLPLVACISLSASDMWGGPPCFDSEYRYLRCTIGYFYNWIPALVFIPLYQFLLYPLFHRWVPSMLKRIGAAMFLQLLGFLGYTTVMLKGASDTGVLQEYLTCTNPSVWAVYGEWYLRVPPLLVFGIGENLLTLLQLELVIAQSPDKMKGLVFGVQLACKAIGQAAFSPMNFYFPSTWCYSVSYSITLMLLFLVFLCLSKRYKFRERNRVVNIQAIAEEHYERYLDQEEEYMREQHQRFTEENVTVHV